jgi:hypothetical protein
MLNIELEGFKDNYFWYYGLVRQYIDLEMERVKATQCICQKVEESGK